MLHCEAAKDASRGSEMVHSAKDYWRYVYVIDWLYRQLCPVLNVTAP